MDNGSAPLDTRRREIGWFAVEFVPAGDHFDFEFGESFAAKP
jgi:hypothetical protein